MYRVSREIDFCYGHRLLNYDGKCKYLHGHNGRAVITIESEKLDARGMVLDFSDIKRVVAQWIDDNLDHRMLLHRDDPAVETLKKMGEPMYLLDVNPTAENIAKLMGVIRPLEPRFYQTYGKPAVTRTDEDLATFYNLYFQTSLGIVDVLSKVPPIGDYATVAAHAQELELFGRKCKVISLDDLIAVKAHVARPKDKLVEIELRAIRERLR